MGKAVALRGTRSRGHFAKKLSARALTFLAGGKMSSTESASARGPRAEKKRSLDSTDASREDRENVVLALALNYRNDPQRANRVQATFEYIRGWYESLQQHSGMKGVVLTNMYVDSFKEQYESEQVKFQYIDTEKDPSFSEHRDGKARSINDQRYYIVEAFLRERQEDYKYVLMTDIHDVVFLNNPFHFMEAVDSALRAPQIFVGSEYSPGIPWVQNKWRECMPSMKVQHQIFNAGILGARTSTFLEFVKKMTQGLDKTPHGRNCNMAVFNKLCHEEYHANLVTGWPVHTRFKNFNSATDGAAFIRHH